jgi:abhydrolase domain-containing protein 6
MKHLLTRLIFDIWASIQEFVFNYGLLKERDKLRLVLKTIRIHGHPTTYLERKGEGDTILLIHGFAGNKDEWISFVRYLPKAYRILAVNLSGHGDSIHDMSKIYTSMYYTQDLTHLIEKLKLKRFHIVGSSFGGLVSKLYAANNSEKVITLTLFASSGIYPETLSEFQLALEKGENPFVVNSSEEYEHFLKLIFHKQGPMPWPVRSVLERKWIQDNPFNLKMWDDIMENFYSEEDSLNLLHLLQMPTLIVWANKDRIIHISSVEVYKKHLPGAKIVIMENCGHVPFVELPKESAEHYTQFLQQVSTGDS